MLEKLRKFENLHIVFWLIKDSCWMLELKWLGVIMIFPTLTIAGIIIFHTKKTIDVFLNLAILFWILGNSFWMFSEFFNDGKYKLLASFPFGLGFVFLGFFYYKTWNNKHKI